MKKAIPIFLRHLGLMKFADKIRFYILYFKTAKQRKKFKRNNSNIVLPPPFYLYETFNLNYESFYNKSIETAEWLTKHFKKYKKLESINILDWGFGPGRVIRHLPDLIKDNCNFYGTDYNPKYVKWCSKNLKGIKFSQNQLEPPLIYDSNTFDIIYGISIFTHLSEKMHTAWFNELMRVMKPGGILLITLQGDAFTGKLSDSDKRLYKEGKLVVKGNTKEGHRTYGAFHPEIFVKGLIGNNKVLEHIEGKIVNNKPQQDLWIIQKS